MGKSLAISKVNDAGFEADVSMALSRMGTVLGADAVLLLRRRVGTDDLEVVEVWHDPDDPETLPVRGAVVHALTLEIPELDESDAASVAEIDRDAAESIRGRAGDTAMVGMVSGSADLAVVLVFSGKMDSPGRVKVATAQFCDLVGQIVKGARAERLLDQRLKLEIALSDASAGFAKIGPDLVDEEIGRHLARLGGLFDALVATVWDDDPDDGRVHRTHSWVNPHSGVPTDYPIEVLPVDHPISTSVRSLRLAGVVDFADHLGSDEPRQGQYLVAAPLIAEKEVVGAVTFAFDRSADSDADSDFWCATVTGFAALVSQVRRRVRAELGESRGREVDSAVAGIARMLVEAESSSFTAVVEDAMQQLGRLVGASNCEYYSIDAPGKVVDLVASWNPSSGGNGEREVDTACTNGTGVCESCGRIVATIEVDGSIAGKIACDVGCGRAGDPVVQGIMDAVASLISQFRRRCDAELDLAARRTADTALREFAASLISPDSTVDPALELLKSALGASHLSLWREHAAWRSKTYCRAECVARVGAAGGPGHIRLPLNLLHAVRQPADVVNQPINNAPRWLRDAVGESLSPKPRCMSVVTSPIGPEETAIIFVLSDGVKPVDDMRSDMMLRAAGMLAQHQARVVAEEMFEASFESAPSAIAIRGTEGRLISCNEAYLRFTGRSRDELIGGKLDDLLAVPGTVGEVSEDETYSELPYRRLSGEVVWGRARFSHIRLAGRPEPVLLSHIEDVTDARHASMMITHRANHDTLTDLSNREYFFELLDTGGSTEGCAIIVADLDKFADINDTFGHHVGDLALITCSDRLRLALRPGDTICRLGGDEFAIHLSGDVSEQEVAAVAARLLSLMREPLRLDGHEIRVTLSIGSATGTPSSTIQDLVRSADAAMYRAKQTGRDRYVVFDNNLRNELADHLEVESQLRDSFHDGRFEVHYQPEVDLDTGRIVGTEALVRWSHPERGLLAAGAFIDVAEHSGLIVELGRWVLVEAARQAAAWRELGHDLVMRVNLSTRQLRPAVVDEIRDALLAAGLRPDHLCLEVTETAIMDDVEEAMDLLHQISDLGVKLAIDDFGTGYSSLAYLKRFPVDILKIDKTFVDGVGIDGQDTGIVDTVIRLGRALNLEVVAEGIENASQIDDLRRMGCHRGQGFYMARPASASHISTLLAEKSQR